MRQNAAAALYLGVCLLLGIRHPGSWLERVPSAGGFLADLLLAEAGGGGVALGQSLCRSCHQTLLVLFGLQGQIFVLGLLGLHFDLLPVRLVLQQLLHNTKHGLCVRLFMASAHHHDKTKRYASVILFNERFYTTCQKVKKHTEWLDVT